MPEVILPCPACGGDCLIVAKNYPSGKWHTYCDCGQIGRLYPTREEAIKAHNALPRSLTWTHEPPVVAGLYMLRAVLTALGDGQYGPIQLLNITQDMLVYSHRKDFQWAGPIPSPID